MKTPEALCGGSVSECNLRAAPGPHERRVGGVKPQDDCGDPRLKNSKGRLLGVCDGPSRRGTV